MPLKVCTVSEGVCSTPTGTQERNESEMTPGLRQKIHQADGISDLKGQIENIINKSDAAASVIDAEGEDVTNYDGEAGQIDDQRQDK